MKTQGKSLARLSWDQFSLRQQVQMTGICANISCAFIKSVSSISMSEYLLNKWPKQLKSLHINVINLSEWEWLVSSGLIKSMWGWAIVQLLKIWLSALFRCHRERWKRFQMTDDKGRDLDSWNRNVKDHQDIARYQIQQKSAPLSPFPRSGHQYPSILLKFYPNIECACLLNSKWV